VLNKHACKKYSTFAKPGNNLMVLGYVMPWTEFESPCLDQKYLIICLSNTFGGLDIPWLYGPGNWIDCVCAVCYDEDDAQFDLWSVLLSCALCWWRTAIRRRRAVAAAAIDDSVTSRCLSARYWPRDLWPTWVAVKLISSDIRRWFTHAFALVI